MELTSPSHVTDFLGQDPFIISLRPDAFARTKEQKRTWRRLNGWIRDPYHLTHS